VRKSAIAVDRSRQGLIRANQPRDQPAWRAGSSSCAIRLEQISDNAAQLFDAFAELFKLVHTEHASVSEKSECNESERLIVGL
jgi:hypothetical protein